MNKFSNDYIYVLKMSGVLFLTTISIFTLFFGFYSLNPTCCAHSIGWILVFLYMQQQQPHTANTKKNCIQLEIDSTTNTIFSYIQFIKPSKNHYDSWINDLAIRTNTYTRIEKCCACTMVHVCITVVSLSQNDLRCQNVNNLFQIQFIEFLNFIISIIERTAQNEILNDLNTNKISYNFEIKSFSILSQVEIKENRINFIWSFFGKEMRKRI